MMGRFDRTDDAWLKSLETLTRLEDLPVSADARYREHWIMKRYHGDRITNWTKWHQGRVSVTNIQIFFAKYPAFEIIESPSFSLDGVTEGRVAYQWCKHELYGYVEGRTICRKCITTLESHRREYDLLR